MNLSKNDMKLLESIAKHGAMWAIQNFAIDPTSFDHQDFRDAAIQIDDAYETYLNAIHRQVEVLENIAINATRRKEKN